MKWWLLGALGLALVVRLAILAGPLGELDADEAVVGLMARHIAFNGELPVFYYGQAYLGSLEAFTAVPLFVAFRASGVVLKLVPLAYSLGFLVLSALVARRVFGDGAAVLTAFYLALPPAMWALWSTKARGGYAEVLFLGEALLLVSLWLGRARRPIWGVLAWGVFAGLALWTHLLAVVYIVPSLVFLALRRRSWTPLDVLAAAAGCVVGAAPLLAANVTHGFETLDVVGGPSGVRVEPAGELLRFLRVGISMLAGVGRPVPPPTLTQDMAWDVPTAGPWPIVAALVLALLGVLWLYAGSLRALLSRTEPGPRADASLLVMVALMVPLTLVLTSYGYFMAEPRYALPLYSVVPLVAAAVWRLPGALRWLTCGAVVALNLWNILATAALVVRPAGLMDTTPANRAVLIDYLEHRDRHQVYTDYWIAQTIMFESADQVQAAVISDGPNRYLPAADNVAQTPNAVAVFVRNSDADQRFSARLQDVGGTADIADVDIYRVYADVTPLETVLDAFD
jgi:hypothetical protein